MLKNKQVIGTVLNTKKLEENIEKKYLKHKYPDLPGLLLCHEKYTKHLLSEKETMSDEQYSSCKLITLLNY